jgi:ribosomal-protein-alanine N-acetyltransferase
VSSLYTFWGFWPVALPVIGRAEARDADELADIHHRSFHRGWGADDFATMLGDRTILAHTIRRRASAPVAGFVISRLAADEAEILSIAVTPKLRGRGYGGRLIAAHVQDLMRAGIRQLFLEVEAENKAALTLYGHSGFAPIGRRKGYYKTEAGVADAVMMRRNLPPI